MIDDEKLAISGVLPLRENPTFFDLICCEILFVFWGTCSEKSFDVDFYTKFIHRGTFVYQ